MTTKVTKIGWQMTDMNPQISQGVLAIWHDLEPSSEVDFQEWHTRQHMIERLSVPGFLRGCRYAAVESSPQVFNFYLTESPEVLTSAAYLERLNNPTEWTRRVTPTMLKVNRSAGRVVARVGMGQGGAIATLRIAPLPEKRDCFEAWLVESGLPKLAELPGIVAAHLWNADAAASGVETTESRARGSSAGIADWILALEGNDVEFVRAASDWLRQQKEFMGALQDQEIVGIYRLQHHLDAQSIG